MLAVERQKNILEVLKRDGIVKVNLLSGEYGVSEETIRRDLQKLEAEGHLFRTYGGAYLSGGVNPDIPVDVREEFLVQGKSDIAERCLPLIEAGDTIMLDCSTTALHLARRLAGFSRLTVITNSVKIVSALAEQEHIKVLCCGGTLRARSLSFVGPDAERTLENYYADKAFVSCTAVDVTRGLTDTNEMEAQIRRKMFQRASRKILIADTTKFNNTSFAVICPLSEVDMVVSDQRIDESFERALREKGISYHFPAGKGD